MSRRNQVRRRRTYGRRQHAVRERRPGDVPGGDAWARTDDWPRADLIAEQRPVDDDSYGSMAR